MLNRQNKNRVNSNYVYLIFAEKVMKWRYPVLKLHQKNIGSIARIVCKKCKKTIDERHIRW